jgi:ubiquinone/menaquinone biosynthesis C-methylase UbiE
MDRFNPDNRHRLLSEQRYAMLPPEHVLDLVPLRDDAIVGDIGCGPGFFTLPLAERLTSGRVYAADIEPVMLQMVQERAEVAGIANIQTILTDADTIPLPAASLDGAFFALVYHEVPNRVSYLAQLARLVRPGGWLALLEWERRENPIGGPSLASRIPPEQAATEAATAGWRVTGQHALNEWLYLIIAEREAD